MKIRLTERQYKLLTEANLTYSPEKIDEFLKQCGDDISRCQNMFSHQSGVVTNLTINEILDNLQLDKVREVYDKYYDFDKFYLSYDKEEFK